MIKILIVDDEVLIHELISEYVEPLGYRVFSATDGKTGLELFETQDVDIVLMDVMMPQLDGFNATRQMKKKKDTPIIMLSARTSEEDKVYGFEMGVDDYVTKPFSLKELMARIHRLTLKTKGNEPARYGFGPVILDLQGRYLMVDGIQKNLSAKEFDLLAFLMKNENRIYSRQSLIDQIWPNDFMGDERTVDTHIKMLRNHLGPYRYMIRTIRLVGYKFET